MLLFHHTHHSPAFPQKNPLTVRLLEARTGAGTTELLGLAAAVVGNEEGAVELDEGLLEQVLGVLVDELLVVGDEGLGNSLADGVDLRGVTTTGDADADVEVGELVKADNEEGLVDLLRGLLALVLSITTIFPHCPMGNNLEHAPSQSRGSCWMVSFGGKAGMSYLEAQDLGLDQLQRAAVDLDEALTSLSQMC